MARYRFNWQNLPAEVLDAIINALGLETDGVETLRKWYGARPKADFVAEVWPVLLRLWLPNDPEASRDVATACAAAKLGNFHLPLATPEQQLAYLGTCRNAATLRAIVLERFITAGEPAEVPTPSQRETAADTPPTRDAESPSRSEQPASLAAFVEETIRTGLGLAEVERDEDGDIPLVLGSAVCFVRTESYEDLPDWVLLFAPLVQGVNVSPELYESLNEINLQLPLGRVTLSGDQVTLETSLLADALSPKELLWAVDFVANAANHFDTLLVRRHGGDTFLAHDQEDEVDV
jgi:hypothetical protein